MLEINNISKSFGAKHVINDISFKVEKGEILGILGPNGAGKTTMMKIICGLITPDSGSALFNDKNIELEDINVVFEGTRQFYWPVSCIENIYYFSALKGVFKEM